MSQLFARLQGDMKECMKSGNKERLEAVRMMLSEVKNAQVNTPGGRDREWSDAEITTLLANYHKTLVKTMAEYPADRQEKLKKEIAIVEEYLPRQMAGEELRAFIRSEVESSPERNFGLLMKRIQPKLAGRADGRAVSETLKSVLTELG